MRSCLPLKMGNTTPKLHVITPLTFAGEIVEISHSGYKSLGVVPRPGQANPAFCIFEYVYFSRSDSVLEGKISLLAREDNSLVVMQFCTW